MAKEAEEVLEEQTEVQQSVKATQEVEEERLKIPAEGSSEGMEPSPEQERESEGSEEHEEPSASRDSSPQALQERVAAAREQVLGAEEEIEECLRNIQQDLEAFEAYEQASLLPVVEESRRLLETIGMEEAKIEPRLPEVDLEEPEAQKMMIEDLSSGKGGALFWGLIAAVATVGGWYAYATQKAGISLLPQKLPDLTMLSTLAGKVSLLLGPAENPSVGAAVVIGSALVVWWLVYMVLVALRASKNRRLTEEIEEEAGFYCKKKEECKAMMQKVREHLETLRQTAQKYEVLLDEKNAGLRRALFVEEAESYDDLHERSKELAQQIDQMLKELDRLLSTPMARSGMLTKESEEALRHAKRVVNDQILRLYS